MRTLRILLKKEWVESIRKHRLLVMAIVFLLFGIMSPLTAKYLPEIVKMILGATAETSQIGMLLPEPIMSDSYVQYYKNLTQMGIFVQILVFMGLVAEEKTKGTVVLILTKSVSRASFLIAKWLMSCFVVVVSLIPSFAAFYLYTWMLFDKAPSLSSLTGLLMYLVLSVFILTFTFFASTVAGSVALSAMISISGYFAVSIVSVIPKVSDYFPMKLSDAAYQISIGASSAGDYGKSLLATLLAIIALTAVSVLSFRYQEL